jgi:hypothetical protein
METAGFSETPTLTISKARQHNAKGRDTKLIDNYVGNKEDRQHGNSTFSAPSYVICRLPACTIFFHIIS